MTDGSASTCCALLRPALPTEGTSHRPVNPHLHFTCAHIFVLYQQPLTTHQTCIIMPAHLRLPVFPPRRPPEKTHVFDVVFGEEASQREVYRRFVSDRVQKFLEGFNTTVMAYGQTGSGKTHTMGREGELS